MANLSLREKLVNETSDLLHKERRLEAAKLIAEFSKAPTGPIDNEPVALEWCSSLLYSLLNSDDYELAAHLLWGRNLFDPRPSSTRRVWAGIRRSNSLMLQGSASQSKTFSAGVWLFLDWIRDPEFTSVNLVGPSEDHLRDNLFSHLVALHQQSTIPLPGNAQDLFIGTDPKNRRGAIRGVIIPIGTRPSGRLQGRKRYPRPTPHPTLGKLSRIRFLLDEVEKIPVGVWKDVDNIFSNLTTDKDGFKIVCAFNPENPVGPVAQRCEPPDGWERFNIETDHEWVSKRGWDVVRLDAKYSENVVEKREIFPGLQTYEGYQRIIQSAGGENAPGALSMARGAFPATGSTFAVFPGGLLPRLRGEFIFAEPPETFAGADLALEGKDSAEICFGRFGRAVGFKEPPSLNYPEGRETLFTNKEGGREFRHAAQVDEIVPLPSGDTPAMTGYIREECNKRKLDPGKLMVDRTGNGAGVHDMLMAVWSQEVRGLNYTEAATETKILAEDTKNARQIYSRVVSELWFAVKIWTEFNFLKIKPALLTEALALELTTRLYAPGKLTQVESKREYRKRGNKSPNSADALTLFLHCIRVVTHIAPSSLSGLSAVGSAAGYVDYAAPVPCWSDSTNRLDYLDKELPDDFEFAM